LAKNSPEKKGEKGPPGRSKHPARQPSQKGPGKAGTAASGAGRGKASSRSAGPGDGKGGARSAGTRSGSGSEDRSYAKNFRGNPSRRNPKAKSGTGSAQASEDQRKGTRLNKYIASSGICSRREADGLITAGLVSINGKVVTTLGTKVNPGDEVRYNGERIRNEKKIYLLLNKPKDYVTTTYDPKERKTVMALIKNACPERIYPVGRLDRNTTGVLLFTNDGEMAKKLTHPSHNKKKIYHVFLDKKFTQNDLKTLAEGIELEDGFIKADSISYVHPENRNEIGLEIHSGRNRIVRRMFESLGYKVTKLDRVYFAGLTKKNLPRGKWRFLTEKEINRLKMNAYE